MTLNTRIHIDTGERDPDQVKVTATNIFFNVVRFMVGSTEDTTWHTIERHEDADLPLGTTRDWSKDDVSMLGYPLNDGFANDLDQGLNALVDVHYGRPNLLMTDYGADDETTDALAPADPAGTVSISFDTAYSYRDDQGRSCGDLHAIYIKVIGQACEHVGWAYHWLNEFTGQWHDDWRVAADELGEGATAATDWFHNMVQPIMDAEAAVEGVELEWE